MHIYTYLYISIHIYTYLYTIYTVSIHYLYSIYTYLYSIYTYLYSIYTYLYTSLHICTYLYISLHILTYLYISVHICTYLHISTHAYMHIYMYPIHSGQTGTPGRRFLTTVHRVAESAQVQPWGSVCAKLAEYLAATLSQTKSGWTGLRVSSLFSPEIATWTACKTVYKGQVIVQSLA